MSEFMNWFGSISDPWAAAMVRASIKGGAALAIVWAIGGLFAKLPPAVKCWLWRLAYLKLVITLVWTTPIHLFVLPSRPAAAAKRQPLVLARDQTRDTRAEGTHDIPSTLIGGQIAGEAVVESTNSAQANRRSAMASSLREVAMAIWVLGCAAALGALAARFRSTARLRRRAGPVTDAQLLDCYRHLAVQATGRRAPALLTCDELSSPLLIGILHPVIVLPTGLSLQLPLSRMRLILAHELAHFRRHDLLWAWLASVCRAVFWFHPLVWLAERQWCTDQESACDQAALAATRVGAAEYGRTLLDICSQRSISPRQFAAVGVVASRCVIERRILAMRHFKAWSPRRRLTTGLVLAFIGIVGVVPWKLAAQQPSENPPVGLPPAAAPPAASETEPGVGLRQKISALPETQRHQVAEWAQTKFLYMSPAARAEAAPDIWVAAYLTTRHAREGRIFADEIVVGAQTAGVIREVACHEGQRVKKGDLLVQFDDRTARAALQQAQARFKLAELEYKRTSQLLNSKAISQEEIAAAESKRDVSAADVEITEHEVERGSILSPISGIVANCPWIAGQVVQSGAGLATIVDVDSLKLGFKVQDRYASRLHPGQEFDVYRPGDDQPFAAKIYFISPIVSGGDMLDIKATIKNRDGLLKSGMRVQVDLGPLGEPQ